LPKFDVAETLQAMRQAFFTQKNSPVNEEMVIKPKKIKKIKIYKY